MKKYYRFTESNDHEGETWHFYIPSNPANDKKMATIKGMIAKSDFYSVHDELIDENIVDILVKWGNSSSGYMDTHNKMKGIAKLPKDFDPEDWDNDPFYKGNLWN